MKRSLVEIYALAVCFAAIVCFAVALGIAGYQAIKIFNPDFTLSSYEFERHQTNEAFVKQNEALKSKTPEEVTKLRTESYKASLKREKRNGLQSLTRTGIVMLVDVVLFSVHWAIARRARTAVTGCG
jgi:uncharacterized membrane protein YraQ (UPF0718 family)